ncbi:MAG: non-homologous end-joining DNA ligase [Clostridia bacterium]|nr:non-homologous end-joining DNA ligase [Clostridia bacterium]
MSDSVAGVEISSPEKILYPKDKITKLDVAKYYEKVAPLMLPYLNKRLLSVIRCHQGIGDACFYKKHPTTENEYVKSFLDGDDEYFYVSNKKELVYQAQMGTIEFHTWGSQIPKIEKPNVMVFDLDPDEKLPIEKLREGVKLLKNVLDKLDLMSFLKTSGGKGYHIVVPFSNSKNWDSFNNFAKKLASFLESNYPNVFTSNIRKSERGGKIFVDWLRNSKGATCIAPYSLRSRDGATISMPISWRDLDKILPNEVNIKNYTKYIKQNDPWQEFFNVKQKLK